MKIIAIPNNLYTNIDYIKIVNDNDYIKGISLDIIMTKDNKIVVYSPVNNNAISINVIQNSSLPLLKESSDIRELGEFLNNFRNWNKKIFLNILPLDDPPVTDATIKQINEHNWNYVSTIKDIINKYPNLDLYLYSSNYRIVYYVKEQITNFKNGIILSSESLNYIDTDFYVFTFNLLDETIMIQQLNKGKEIMVSLPNDYALAKTMNFLFEEESNKNKERIFNEGFALTPYPGIVNKALSNN